MSSKSWEWPAPANTFTLECGRCAMLPELLWQCQISLLPAASSPLVSGGTRMTRIRRIFADLSSMIHPLDGWRGGRAEGEEQRIYRILRIEPGRLARRPSGAKSDIVKLLTGQESGTQIDADISFEKISEDQRFIRARSVSVPWFEAQQTP